MKCVTRPCLEWLSFSSFCSLTFPFTLNSCFLLVSSSLFLPITLSFCLPHMSSLVLMLTVPVGFLAWQDKPAIRWWVLARAPAMPVILSHLWRANALDVPNKQACGSIRKVCIYLHESNASTSLYLFHAIDVRAQEMPYKKGKFYTCLYQYSTSQQA